MKQKDIYDEIAEAVGRKMGDNFIVELHEVVKENDNVQHGLVIRDNAKSVAPVLYLDQMVEELGQLMPAEVMADKIIQMYEEIGEPPIEMEGFSLEWEDIKDNLELHVAGLQLNRERLKDALYLPAGNGLVLVPYVRVAESGDGYMQCMITKEIADKSNYDLRELFGQAMENTVEKYPPVLGDLTDMMLNLNSGKETDPRSEDFALPEAESTNRDPETLSSLTGTATAAGTTWALWKVATVDTFTLLKATAVTFAGERPILLDGMRYMGMECPSIRDRRIRSLKRKQRVRKLIRNSGMQNCIPLTLTDTNESMHIMSTKPGEEPFDVNEYLRL